MSKTHSPEQSPAKTVVLPANTGDHICGPAVDRLKKVIPGICLKKNGPKQPSIIK